MEKIIGPNVGLQYIKTKKVAMVSSRDQYICMVRRDTPANMSPSGRRKIIIAGKSKELEEYPPTQGVVRARTLISGFYIDVLKPDVLDVHFIVESDFKLSIFIQKQVGPAKSNYPDFLAKYIEELSD